MGQETTLAIIYKKPILCLSQNRDYGKSIYSEGFKGEIYNEKNLKKIISDFLKKVSKNSLKSAFANFSLSD